MTPTKSVSLLPTNGPKGGIISVVNATVGETSAKDPRWPSLSRWTEKLLHSPASSILKLATSSTVPSLAEGDTSTEMVALVDPAVINLHKSVEVHSSHIVKEADLNHNQISIQSPPLQGAWSKKLIFSSASTSQQDFGKLKVSSDIWPSLSVSKTQQQKHGMKNLQKPVAMEDDIRFPWAAKMNPISRNLYRAAEPEYLEDGTPKQRKKRQIPPTLASVDALENFTQLSSHPLHKTSKPGIFSMDILHSKDVIATGGIDTAAVLFNLPSGQILSTLTGHSKKVTSIKFVGDTDLVLTASSDKTVRIWGSSEGGNYACRHTLKDHSAEVRAVTVHATNKYFVSASLDSTWCFYDLSSGLCLAQVTDDSEKVDYTAAAFHPDGLILGTGTAQSIVKIWDVKSQANVAKFGGHTGEITSVSFSENGYFLATAALDGVRLWDLRKLKNFRTFEFPDANSVEFDHSGSYLGIAASDIRVFQTASVKAEWNPIKTLPDLSGTGKATCVKFGPDAKYVAVGSMDRNLRIFGLPSNDTTEDSAQDS